MYWACICPLYIPSFCIAQFSCVKSTVYPGFWNQNYCRVVTWLIPIIYSPGILCNGSVLFYCCLITRVATQSCEWKSSMFYPLPLPMELSMVNKFGWFLQFKGCNYERLELRLTFYIWTKMYQYNMWVGVSERTESYYHPCFTHCLCLWSWVWLISSVDFYSSRDVIMNG